MSELIKNPLRASQIIDFGGLMKPPIAPTDIDGLVEWKDRAYILIEVKHNGKDVPIGQKLALERMVRDFQKAGKYSVAIVVDHNVDDTQKSVFVKDCKVRKIYQGKQWRDPKKPCTAKQFIDSYIKCLEFLN